MTKREKHQFQTFILFLSKRKCISRSLEQQSSSWAEINCCLTFTVTTGLNAIRLLLLVCLPNILTSIVYLCCHRRPDNY